MFNSDNEPLELAKEVAKNAGSFPTVFGFEYDQTWHFYLKTDLEKNTTVTIHDQQFTFDCKEKYFTRVQSSKEQDDLVSMKTSASESDVSSVITTRKYKFYQHPGDKALYTRAYGPSEDNFRAYRAYKEKNVLYNFEIVDSCDNSTNTSLTATGSFGKVKFYSNGKEIGHVLKIFEDISKYRSEKNALFLETKDTSAKPSYYFQGSLFGEQKNNKYVISYPYAGQPLDKITITSIEKLKQIFILCLQELQNLHERGLIHRDIKPANICYNPKSNQVKIIDPGLLMDKDNEDESKVLCGTLFYQPPEMTKAYYTARRDLQTDMPLDAYPYSQQTDLYALGITLQELLTHSNSESKTLAQYALSMCHPDPKKRPELATLVKDINENKTPDSAIRDTCISLELQNTIAGRHKNKNLQILLIERLKDFYDNKCTDKDLIEYLKVVKNYRESNNNAHPTNPPLTLVSSADILYLAISTLKFTGWVLSLPFKTPVLVAILPMAIAGVAKLAQLASPKSFSAQTTRETSQVFWGCWGIVKHVLLLFLPWQKPLFSTDNTPQRTTTKTDCKVNEYNNSQSFLNKQEAKLTQPTGAMIK